MAAPIAIAVVVQRRWDPERIFVVVIAMMATGVTWMFQYTGGAEPQWGGRYLLAPTLLLVCVGVVAIRDADRLIRLTAIVFAVTVTAFGVGWLHERTHGVDDFFDRLASQPDDVIISTNGFFVREAGPAYHDRRYLSLGRHSSLEGAVEVVERAGLKTFGILTEDADAPAVDAVDAGTTKLSFLGSTLWLHSYDVTTPR